MFIVHRTKPDLIRSIVRKYRWTLILAFEENSVASQISALFEF